MASIILAFFTSLLLNIGIMATKDFHLKWTTDDLNKKHSVNKSAIPRIGGVGIFLGAACVCLYEYIRPNSNWYPLLKLLVAVMPIFILGVLEDLFKNITPLIRLVGSFLTAILFMYLFNIENKEEIKGIWAFVIYATTIIYIALMINSYNIIDGLNGLSSMMGIISMVAIAYIAYRVNDWMILHIAVLFVAAILGFFIINYPMGGLFLGDSGAYLIGFISASLSVLLIYRNENATVWSVLLINIYPIYEMIFTVIRRILTGKNPIHADKAHLHSLMYRKLANHAWFRNDNNHYNITPIIWCIASIGAVPAALFWNDNKILLIYSILYITTYNIVYFILKIRKDTKK